MKPNPFRLLRCLALAAFAAMTGAAAVSAQTFEPAIVVNEKAITQYELDQRARLLQALGAGGDTRELARSQLIDDRLRMALVERFELEPSEDEILDGLQEFAARREMELGRILAELDRVGVDEATLRAFVEVGLGWRNVVQARFRNLARVSEQDLENALNFANDPVQARVLLQELSLATQEYGETEATELAERLSRELNRGGDFTAAVRRYSRAPSAPNDGRLDWLPVQDLPAAVATQVMALMPGEVTAPIPLGRGISIFKLRDIRYEERTPAEVEKDLVTYYQLIEPLPADASPRAIAAAQQRLNAIAARAELCRDLNAAAGDFGIGSGRSEPVRLGTVPARIRAVLQDMQTGEKEVIRDNRGVVLVMLCARSGETSPEEREELRRQLFNQRMGSFAQAFLQELRGDAVIVEK